ncbi:MAG: hypothetical protein GQ572_06915 [Gammaproteobacteria bacterium]|nr:hypothetical protein [Gammaproteobacteria bacterium]
MKWILRFRVYVIICLAVVLISAAVIFSVLRAVLPYATGYKNEIQLEISQQIGLPVKINSIDAAIHWFSPRLKLIDVVVFDEDGGDQLFNFKEAFVELDVIASILRQELIVDDIGLVGANITIEKLSDTEWKVQGVNFTSKGTSELPEQFLYMLNNSDFLLHDSNIYFQDYTKDKLSISLLDVNIDVESNFNNHEIKLSMNLPEGYGRDLAVVANLHGGVEVMTGDIYVEAHQLNLQRWNDKFNLYDDYQVEALFDIDLWLTLDDRTIEDLYVRFASEDFSVKNNATKKIWNTNYLSSSARYVHDKTHWNLAVTDFYFGEQSKPEWQRPVNLLISDDDDNYYLSADFLRFDDLHNIVEVFLDEEMLVSFNKLKSYEIQSDIYNLNLQLPKDMSADVLMNDLYLDATVIDLAIKDSINNVGISGLDMALHFDDRQALLDINSKDTEIDFTELFRWPLFAEVIAGKIELTQENERWQLASNRLQVKNSHINTFTRLDINFTSLDDIFTDIQTNFYDADARYTKNYLPVGIMSPALVRWLDMAVTDANIPSGEFILNGYLDDFPYDDSNGVFQVLFSPKDINMQFLENWPSLRDTSATIKFNNKSLFISNANGQTLGAKLLDSRVVIPDLSEPYLTANIHARSNVEEVQSYIWKSPLHDLLGNTMRLFQFNGSSDLKLELGMPLNGSDVDVSLDGHLSLINGEMYYPALGYEIDHINGVIDFTKDSIFADSIKAKIQGENVSINAITKNGTSGREVVFNIDGSMAADYLLLDYQWIPEKWFSGSSRWSVDIEVPYQPKDYFIRIKADTDFNNVGITLSDKVYKSPADALNFSAIINVLESNGLHVYAVASFNDDVSDSELQDGIEQEKLFDLYAQRDENNIWAFDINSNYITGKGIFAEGLGKDTQVKLNLESVDLHALFITKGENQTETIQPNEIPPLDLSSKKVLWDDMSFRDVRLVTDWHKHGMLIDQLSLKGPSMAFDANGTWLTSWRNSHETVLEGSIKGSNLGETLAGLGFEKSIDRGKYKAVFNARWPTEPYGLSWENVKGESSFELKKGQILDVDPGSGGRLLGLLNIFKLTNRLAFDFNDVTRKGFSFDSIEGEFEFVNGDGALNDFDVSAPAADINMFGSIDLIKQDYGLLMRVKPHTDTLTFAGGALLGGVAVGAGLALIQKVFDLGVIGHNVYSITGSWDDPQVEKIVERTLDSESDDDDF